MEKTSEQLIKKELIKILNKSKIEEMIYEPRYYEDVLQYGFRRTLRGATITIRTSLKK